MCYIIVLEGTTYMENENQYKNWYYEHEGKYYALNVAFRQAFKQTLQNKLPKHSISFNRKMVEQLDEHSAFIRTLENLSSLTNPLRAYVKDQITACISPTYLVRAYMELLSDLTYDTYFNNRKTVMKSFKETNLIADIAYNKKEKSYTLTTLNGKEIRFKSLWKKEEDALENKQFCHRVTLSLLRDHVLNHHKVFAVTVEEEYIVKTPMYHTFLIYNGFVHDGARNLLLKYEDYEELIHPTIISFTEGKELLTNIKEMQIKDQAFNELKWEPLLKYAMHKQMIKEKRKY